MPFTAIHRIWPSLLSLLLGKLSLSTYLVAASYNNEGSKGPMPVVVQLIAGGLVAKQLGIWGFTLGLDTSALLWYHEMIVGLMIIPARVYFLFVADNHDA